MSAFYWALLAFFLTASLAFSPWFLVPAFLWVLVGLGE